MSSIHDPIPLKDAIDQWEAVLDGQSRLSANFLRSLYHYGKTVMCEEKELLSSVFITLQLCDSKSDFKRSLGSLYVNEEKIKEDRPIGEFLPPSSQAVLLRKGKSAARLAIVLQK